MTKKGSKFNFTANDKEWHQSLLNLCYGFLKMKTMPVLTYDRNHFKKYAQQASNGNQLWAECVKEAGLIWLSPHLATMPKVDIINTIFHECVHIKYPKWPEYKVRKYADRFVPVTQDLDSKKKLFDVAH